MSVPTHNLYDFVHQATKKQFFLMYFFPWGSRDLKDVIHHQISKADIDGANGIPIENRIALSNISPEDMDHRLAARIQPVILCHDQEPLWFDQYAADSAYMQEHCNQYYNRLGLQISPTHQSQNLRAAYPESLQKTWILLHSELNSPELKRYEATGLFAGAYWWSHALISRDWYRFAEHDLSLNPTTTPDKLFLVYCREVTGWREYRKGFLDHLSALDLNNSCQFQSFHNQIVGPDASAVYESEDINRTGISVVLETVVDERIHLTEKVLRPIACGHPFMLAAGPGSLELLRKYGFKTFSPFIDESYDKILDKTKRLAAIAEEMQRLSQLPKDEIKWILDICQLIAKHNRRHFFSKEFYTTVIKELDTNVKAAYNTFHGQLDFKNWWQERKWHHATQHQAFKQFEKEHDFGKFLVPIHRQMRAGLQP